MTVLPLEEVLALVGELDDSLGENTARQRFRRYLREKLTDIDRTLGYIDAATAVGDEQHARALQDLVNHLGGLLGFSVDNGPYLGLPGQIGYDGLWTSPTGILLVVEVKTGETFAARRAGVARSIERLIAEGRLIDWRKAVGLYVIADLAVDTTHLERLILDEPQSHALRIVSVPALQQLARLQSRGTISHTDTLDLFRSGSPRLDPLVEVMARAASPLTRSDVSPGEAESAQPEAEGNGERDGEEPAARSEPAAGRRSEPGESDAAEAGASETKRGPGDEPATDPEGEPGVGTAEEPGDGRRDREPSTRRASADRERHERLSCPDLVAEIDGMLQCLGEWLARGIELMFDVEVRRRPRHGDPADD